MNCPACDQPTGGLPIAPDERGRKRYSFDCLRCEGFSHWTATEVRKYAQKPKSLRRWLAYRCLLLSRWFRVPEAVSA